MVNVLKHLTMILYKDNDAYYDVDVRDAERSDAGQYYCRAENLVGTRDSDTARLSVHSESSELFRIILDFLIFAVSWNGSLALANIRAFKCISLVSRLCFISSWIIKLPNEI